MAYRALAKRWVSLGGALLVVPLLGAGCISFGGNRARADGGLFVTGDRGERWVQRGAVPTTAGTPASLGNVDVTIIVQDPQDRNALYVGTAANGAYYSWDGGEIWWPLGTPFARGRVDGIAIDPRATCTIYVASGPRVYKTTNCARTWRSSDFEIPVSAVTVDLVSSSIVYAANARGDLLKSTDAGASWRAIHRFENPVKRIVIPTAAREQSTIYVATQATGIFRSDDGGGTWTDLRSGMQGFAGAFDFRALIPAGDRAGTLLHASRYGILRSADRGTTWQPLTLITAAATVDILSLGVNPRNSQEIAYTSATTFYKSSDGGRTWVSRKLPTSRAASFLHVDSANGNLLWMGTLQVKR